jgi:cytoskeletal protein RodZ
MQESDPQAHSELATFGEELRREREIRGISLKEIADATKISKRFLEAIERNDHKTLPAPVFTRGFVREYARYLGLNAEEIVNRYNYAAAGDDRIEQTAHLDRLVPERAAENTASRKPAKSRGIPSPIARVDRNIYLLILIALALAGLTYWAVRHRKITTSVDGTEPAAKPAVAVATPPVAPPVPASAVTATNGTSSPASADTLRLTLNLLDDAWVSLQADGKNAFTGDLHKGETRTFEAKDNFHFVKIGNAAGIDFILNGVHIAPMGPPGKVLHDKTFDRDLLKAQQQSQPGPQQ